MDAGSENLMPMDESNMEPADDMVKLGDLHEARGTGARAHTRAGMRRRRGGEGAVHTRAATTARSHGGRHTHCAERRVGRADIDALRGTSLPLPSSAVPRLSACGPSRRLAERRSEPGLATAHATSDPPVPRRRRRSCTISACVSTTTTYSPTSAQSLWRRTPTK